ncbi:MAG: methyl-accepting chemotaxis protein [Peptococcaceae bacterium]|nr:methyl-accepting chemotaxis protein [Peptococcaceae bacterium]
MRKAVSNLNFQFLLCTIPILFLIGIHLYFDAFSFNIAVLSGIGLMTYGIIHFWMYAGIKNNLNKAKTLTKFLSRNKWGESVRVKQKNEFGELINELNLVSQGGKNMLENLKAAVAQAEDINRIQAGHIEQLVNNYEHLAALFQQLTAGSSEQIGGMKKVNEKLEIMYTASQKIDTSTKEVLDLAISAKDTSERGRNMVMGARQEMEKVFDVSQKVNLSISTLAQEAKKIGDIVQLINGISQQTDLLALNAAIEAARAGQHGRGFAVVADEVRKLADNTLKSATLIMELIDNVKNLINDSVENMCQVMGQVNKSNAVIESAGEAIDKLDIVIHTTSQKVDENMRKAHAILEQTQELWDIQDSTTAIATGFLEAASTEAERTQKQMHYTQEVVAKSEELKTNFENLNIILKHYIN